MARHDFRPGLDWRDGALSTLLILLNPVTTHLFHYLKLEPDTIAYLSLAAVLPEGELVMEGWGHIDTALILPPLYPALIAAGVLMGADPVMAALLIPRLCMIGFSLLLYLYARQAGVGRVAALAAVLITQESFVYLRYAMTPLTEPLLLFTWALTLLLLQRLLAGPHPSRRIALLAGAAAGACFLARQPGLVLIPGIVLLCAARALTERRGARKDWMAACGWVVVGIAMLVAPYAAAIWQQSGHLPLRQYYRLGTYVIRVPEGPVAAEIRLLRQQTEQTGDYEELVRLRREALRLLPDASETYGAVRIDASTPSPPLRRLVDNILSRPDTVLANLWYNLTTVTRLSGLPLALLSLLLLYPARVCSTYPSPSPLSQGWPIAVTIVLYLLGLSCLTDMVVRYAALVVLFLPLFVVIQTWSWGHYLSSSGRFSGRFRNVAPLSLSLAVAMAAHAGYPRRAGDLELRERIPSWTVTRALFSAITHGQPVLAAAPFDAYLAGGSFRALPNDGLPRVACYARHTGVRWLVTMRFREDREFRRLYPYAGWYLDPAPSRRWPQWLRLEQRLHYGDGGILSLYRILWPASSSACIRGSSHGS